MIIIILLLIIIFIMLLIYFSKIQIEIHDLKNDKREIVERYLVYIKFYVLNIKYFSYKIDNSKIKKLEKSKIINNVLKNKIMKDYKEQIKLLWRNKKEIKKVIKVLKAEIEKLNLKVELSTKSPIIISYKVAIISSQISKILLKAVKKKNYKNVHYKILPIYNNTNYLKIELDCIISVKIAHIIKVISRVIKRSDLKNGATSNRRSNDNCYG